MDRRNFLQTAAITSVAAGLPWSAPAGAAAAAILKPKRLAQGDTVELVAPANATFNTVELQIAKESLEALGFNVKIGAHLLDRHGYLAGDDKARADDINKAFADSSVAAVHAIRGGWGSARLLPHLDFDVIKRNPKIIIGYSDITALLLSLHAKTGLVTFHGPIGLGRWDNYSLEYYKRVLFNGERVTYANKHDLSDRNALTQVDFRTQTITPGKARGRLLGGNLCLMSHLCGTPYFPDLRGAILFLEDVEEAYYRIDRMLTQLWLSGALAGVAGVAFGKFTNCNSSPFFLQNRPLDDILAERCRALGVPAVSGIMVGHIEDQTTLPVGCLAELDADAGTLTLLEPGVS